MKAWIKQAKHDFTQVVNRDCYPELADHILEKFRESSSPFSDALVMLSALYQTNGENYLIARIMADDKLRLAMTDHALIDPITISTKTIREFTRALSSSQSLAYNDLLFERMVAFESAKRGTDMRLGSLLSTHTLSPERLEAHIQVLNLPDRIWRDHPELATTVYFALDLLRDYNVINRDMHFDLFALLAQHNRPISNAAQLAYEHICRFKQDRNPLTLEDKFLVFSAYHCLSRDYKFDLSGVTALSYQKSREWMCQQAITPEALAQMTTIDAQLELGRHLVGQDGSLKIYIHALKNESVIEASLSHDLGL
jgi:hypothetical protein